MKICAVSFDYTPNPQGGVGVAAHELVEKIRKRHEVTVLTIGKERTRSRNNLDVIGFEGTRTYAAGLTLLSLTRKVTNYLRENKSSFDIIHFHEAFTPIPQSLHKITPTRKIATAYGHPRYDLGISIKFSHNFFSKLAFLGHFAPLLFWERATIRYLNKVVCTTYGNKARYLQSYPNLESRIVHIPTGVDFNIFYPRKKNIGENNFICVGRLTRRKNIDFILKSFEKYLRTNDAKLKIVGDGTQRRKLVGLTQKLEIEKNVEFLGVKGRSEIANLMNESKALLSASSYETPGLVILEAMACKTPVIVSDMPDQNEIVKDEETGFLFSLRDMNSLIAAMEKINDRALVRTITENAYVYVSENHDWSKISDTYIDLYYSLLSSKT